MTINLTNKEKELIKVILETEKRDIEESLSDDLVDSKDELQKELITVESILKKLD
ncbi:hypothetical protein J6Y73_05885 [bacterium]|nr:hypothetical protein [bacterium]